MDDLSDCVNDDDDEVQFIWWCDDGKKKGNGKMHFYQLLIDNDQIDNFH